MLAKLQSKNQTRKKLRNKIEKLVSDLSWVENDFPLETLPRFFNVMEQGLAQISEREWKQAPNKLQNVVNSTRRNKWGWFRAEENKDAHLYNTYVVPNDPMLSEYFGSYLLADLLQLKDEPNEQYGFAKEPMTLKTFYYVAFVKPFVHDKINALKQVLIDLS